MTQEEKDILLKDLAARLPYYVVINCTDDDTDYKCFLMAEILDDLLKNFDYCDYKPYLRPMSSMTKEEREEYICIKQGECDGCVLTGKGDPNTEFLLVDFFNSHHLDYRGLIPMGLALEAPEGMYKFE